MQNILLWMLSLWVTTMSDLKIAAALVITENIISLWEESFV